MQLRQSDILIPSSGSDQIQQVIPVVNFAHQRGLERLNASPQFIQLRQQQNYLLHLLWHRFPQLIS